MNNNHYHYIALLVFALIALFFVFGITHVGWILNLVHGDDVNQTFLNKIGTFGDSAGLLNALFSSLAFGGVLLTIFWQVTENRKQRADEHRIQFENVFFNMTNTLEHIVSELKVKREKDNVSFTEDWKYWAEDTNSDENDNKEQYIEGREVFKYIYEEKQPSIAEVVKNEGIFGYEQRMTGLFDSYFRYLYRILKYIDDSKLISDEVKYQYAGILRAHLSYMELPLLYYNGLSGFGREKMKPLMERYHLLKNIREEKLHDQEVNAPIEGLTVDDMYDKSAWETDKKEIMEENGIGSFCWKMAFALLFALIFNTLIADWWHDNVIIQWKGMHEVVIRGLVLIAVTLSLFYYLYRDGQYRKMYMSVKENKKTAYGVWNVLKGNYTLPVFLFLLVTSVYTCIKHQVVWYDTHTIYLDLTFFYFPLIADVIALIVNAVRAADEQIATDRS